MDTPRQEFDSTNVFFFFIRWWKHLAIICLLAAVGAAIFSAPRFITPKYESYTTVFPSTSASLSRSVILAWKDFNEFGEVEEAERLLQVLESATMRDRMIEAFNLRAHYHIPADARYANTMLHEEYRGNFKFRRTRYGAVEIRVRDHNPQMAADMANYITALTDTVMNEMRMERLLLAYEVAEKEYLDMRQQAQAYQDTLRTVMKRGVFDVESQVMMLTRQLAKDLSDRNVLGSDMLEDRLQAVGELGSNQLFQTAFLEIITNDLMILQRRYHEARADMNYFIPFKLVIDKAYVPEKKVYPVRWLIVFLATFGAGFMGVMVMIFYENLLQKGIITEKRKSDK